MKFLLKLQTILFIFLIAVASWLIVHGLTIFGVFIAFAYPLLWLLFPKKIPCLFCRTRKEGAICPLCGQKVLQSNNYAPQTLLSAVYNGCIILAFTLVSFGLVLLENHVLHKMGLIKPPQSVIFEVPPHGQYRLGEIFPLKLETTGIQAPINTVHVDLSFDPQSLEVVNISTTNSFASIFVQKEINNKVGYIRLTGGLPNPGFAKERGVLGTVYFRSKAAGITEVKFLPTSMVLANDGKGSNVLKDFATFPYVILPEKISQKEQEAQKDMMANVLGESTSRTQIKLYEDKDVMKSSFAFESQEVEEDILANIITSIERFDSFVLSPWKQIAILAE